MRLKLNEAEKVFSPRGESPGNMEEGNEKFSSKCRKKEGQGRVEAKRNRWYFYFEH